MAYSLHIQPGKRPGRSRRAENVAETLVGVAGRAKGRRMERERYTATDIVTEYHGAQHRFAIATFPLAHRQRGGHRTAAGMHVRSVMRTIRLVGMCKHAVGKRRVDGRSYQTGSGDTGLLGASQCLDIGN